MYEIQRMTTRQRQQRQTAIYRALIGIAEEVVTSAKAALVASGEQERRMTM